MGDYEKVLKKYYGYDTFRDGQEDIIRHIMSGRDVLAVMPTGSGKSVCYQLPAIMSDGITLAISPLISLMQDQVRSLIANGIRAAYLNSTLTPRQMELAIQNAARGVYKIIYVSPERLETESFVDFAVNSPISLIAVDEAHCISQWGHDFRPSYTGIADFIDKLPLRPVVAAFTATATGMVKNDIERSLHLQDPYRITTGFDRHNLYFGTYRAVDKMSFLMDYIEHHSHDSGIVYCNARKTVEMVADELQQAGFSALPYHAGMSDSARAENQDGFIYDRTKIMVATSAFGMGIDKPNVRYVIHYNMPPNMEEYYQQAGRAGRDGLQSECLLLYSGRDVKINEYLIRNNRDNSSLEGKELEAHIANQLEKLKLMTFYSTGTKECLRKRILGYFGESFRPPCGNCSVCSGEEDFRRYDQPATSVGSANNRVLLIDEALLARLEKCRAIFARNKGVPVYAIVGDTTLRELAAKKPRSFPELSQISGMSDEKQSRYGKALLDVINEYENDAEF